MRVNWLLCLVLSVHCTFSIPGQSPRSDEVFEKIEILSSNGARTKVTPVRIRLTPGAMEIESDNYSRKIGYKDIKSVEYSYSKSPRWKTGLGLGAASVIFPPLILIAIPIGFSHHRRHWLAIRTAEDYALLKLSKSNRKIFILALETRADLRVQALGENK